MRGCRGPCTLLRAHLSYALLKFLSLIDPNLNTLLHDAADLGGIGSEPCHIVLVPFLLAHLTSPTHGLGELPFLTRDAELGNPGRPDSRRCL